MSKTRRQVPVLAMLFALFAFAASTSTLFAQSVVTGDVQGTITDPTGAVVPGAKVELKSSATGFDKAQTTGGNGEFRFSLLKPGAYTLTVSSSQFSSATRNIDVQLGQVTNASLALAVGSSTTTVEVSSQAPLLQTENANITSTVDARAVQELPNPGGDITFYANVTPGVTMNTSGGGYGNFSAFGLPGTSNLFTENGNDENDPFLNLNNSGSSNLLLGKNEVQEVAVVTNGYTGQYGRQAGAAINYTTKSGTNQFHGDATWDWNGRWMNANDWFANHYGTPRPFANSNQWGADFGGPIKKNKTFFYIDTEGLRYILPSEQDVYFPTPAFASSLLANIGAVSPAQLPYYTKLMSLYQGSPAYGSLQSFNASPAATQGGDTTGGCEDLSAPGFGAANPCLGWYHATGENLNKEWILTSRIDQNIGNNDVLFGRVKIDHGQQPTSTDIVDPAVFSTYSVQPSYEGQLNETHTFNSHMVNNFVFSGLYYSAVFVPDSGQSAVLNALGYSYIGFGGMPMSALGGTSTPDYFFPQGREAHQWQAIDDFSWTKGNHEFKFGVNWRLDNLTDYDIQTLTGGYATFNSMTDFYNGSVNINSPSYFVQSFDQKSTVPLSLYSLGLYAQDTWKIKQNLTLTLSLRGDHVSNATCGGNCYSRPSTYFEQLNHDVTVPYNQAILDNQGNAFQNVEAVAWQPRVGFSWNPGFAHNTVLRGGIGVFSDLYPAVLLDNLIENAPNYNVFETYGTGTGVTLAPGLPTSASTLAANSNTSFLNGFANGSNLAAIEAGNAFFSPPGLFSPVNNLNNPKYLEWNFEIEQQFGANNVLTVNYVGNKGYDLLIQNSGLNAWAGTYTPCAGCAPLASGTTITGLPTSPVDSRFTNVTGFSNTGTSNYNGLVTSFTHRFTQGLQFQVNYTWSHALDDVSSSGGAFTPFSSATSLGSQINPYCLQCLNYGPADFDIRHNFNANYIYNPTWKPGNSILRAVLGDWQFSQTFFFRTGLPYSVTDSVAGGAFNGYDNGTILGTYLGGPTTSCGAPSLSITASSSCLLASNFAGPGVETVFGNLARNSFRSPSYFNSDFTAMKIVNLSERFKLRFGVNMFNVFNHPNFAAPVTDVANPAFGTILSTIAPVTSPYGAFQGAGVSGRLIQTEIHLQF